MNFNKYIKLFAFALIFTGLSQTAQAQSATPAATTPSIEKDINGEPLLSKEQLKVVDPSRDYADYIKANMPAPGTENQAKVGQMDAYTQKQISSEKKREEKVHDIEDGGQQ